MSERREPVTVNFRPEQLADLRKLPSRKSARSRRKCGISWRGASRPPTRWRRSRRNDGRSALT